MNHTPKQFCHYIFTFRDDFSEYEDCMDISKCVPSIRMPDPSPTVPPEEQTTLASGSLSPKGATS